jgi:DNA-binding NarL/FixJ family response regulator
MRVLVVADSTMAQAGLAALVEASPGLEVAASVDESAAAGIAQQLEPDVCLLDVEGSGEVEAAVATLTAALDCPLVVVAESDAFASALGAGADGALTPAIPAAALAAALEAVVAGVGAVYPPDALRPRSAREPSPGRAPTSGPVEPLTPRELEVLRLLAGGRTNQQLAGVLGISEHTAKFHVSAVLGKLGAQSRAEAVALGYRLGLVAV